MLAIACSYAIVDYSHSFKNCSHTPDFGHVSYFQFANIRNTTTEFIPPVSLSECNAFHAITSFLLLFRATICLIITYNEWIFPSLFTCNFSLLIFFNCEASNRHSPLGKIHTVDSEHKNV